MKRKAFYVQIEPDVNFIRENIDGMENFSDSNQMHSHFYWLKKAARKMELPFISYKIKATDFRGKEKMEIIQKQFNIGTYE